MARMASPTALVLVAQAVVTGKQGPVAWKRMAMLPAAMLAIIMGMKWGDTRRGPFSSSFWCSAAKVSNPPIPDPK